MGRLPLGGKTDAATAGHRKGRAAAFCRDKAILEHADSKGRVKLDDITAYFRTETVQRLFIKAYNQMMEKRTQIIVDCEAMRKELTDLEGNRP